MGLVDLPRARSREERGEYLSIERVYQDTPDGGRELLYPVGSPVPYEEAVRQGIVTPDDDPATETDGQHDQSDAQDAGGDAGHDGDPASEPPGQADQDDPSAEPSADGGEPAPEREPASGGDQAAAAGDGEEDDVSGEKAVEKPDVEDKAVAAPDGTKASAPAGTSRQTGGRKR